MADGDYSGSNASASSMPNSTQGSDFSTAGPDSGAQSTQDPGTTGNITTAPAQTIGLANGTYALVPSMSRTGDPISADSARTQYDETGQHMGLFSSQHGADSYNQQMYKNNGWTSGKNQWGQEDRQATTSDSNQNDAQGFAKNAAVDAGHAKGKPDYTKRELSKAEVQAYLAAMKDWNQSPQNPSNFGHLPEHTAAQLAAAAGQGKGMPVSHPMVTNNAHQAHMPAPMRDSWQERQNAINAQSPLQQLAALPPAQYNSAIKQAFAEANKGAPAGSLDAAQSRAANLAVQQMAQNQVAQADPTAAQNGTALAATQTGAEASANGPISQPIPTSMVESAASQQNPNSVDNSQSAQEQSDKADNEANADGNVGPGSDAAPNGEVAADGTPTTRHDDKPRYSQGGGQPQGEPTGAAGDAEQTARDSAYKNEGPAAGTTGNDYQGSNGAGESAEGTGGNGSI